MGFFQLQLDGPSTLLTAFNTPFGRYKYTRLPMGINVAPELFQRAMIEIFGDIEGVEVIFDDLLIHAQTVAIHNQILFEILRRARLYNVKFGLRKLQLCQSVVIYSGHQLTDEGVKPDPDKVSCIKNMPLPTSIDNVRTILGMVTYCCKFLKDLSSITETLRNLVKESSVRGFKFHFDNEHQRDESSSSTIL